MYADSGHSSLLGGFEDSVGLPEHPNVGFGGSGDLRPQISIVMYDGNLGCLKLSVAIGSCHGSSACFCKHGIHLCDISQQRLCYACSCWDRRKWW